MAKKKIVVETKYTAKGANEVENAYDGIGDSANKTADATDKVNNSISETGEATKDAKKGLGGMLDGFKAIILSPIGAVVIALAGAIKFVSSALETSEGASNKLAQGFAYLKGFILPLQKAVLSGFDSISNAISKPGETWDSFVVSFENSVDYISTNVIDPMRAGFENMGLSIEGNILKMRISWNEFTGDVEESDELETKLKEVNDAILENEKIMIKASLTLKEDVVDAIDSVIDGVSDYVEEATKLGGQLSNLVKREQDLLKVRRAQEVQNASALANIEALKLIRDNEAESLEDRIKANEEIAKVEKKRVEQSLSLSQAELFLKYASVTHTPFTYGSKFTASQSLLTEEFDKRASLIDKENQLLAIREKNAVTLADAEVQAQLDKLTALRELGLEEKAIYVETQNALELAQASAIQTRLDADIEASETKKALDLKNDNDAITLANKTATQKADIEKALGDAILNFASSLSNALGEESKAALVIQKTVALAQIGIDTAKAISSLSAASAANPGNAFTFGSAGAIQYATGLLQIGSNLAQAYSLLKQPAPQLGGGGGGASAPAPTTTQTAPDLGFQGQSAGSENFGAQTIIKAFVTESDITNSQTNANNIQQLSQIG